MPTIPMPDAATLAAWEEKGLIPPATQRKPADHTPRREKVAGGEIGRETRRNAKRRGMSEAEFQRQVIEFAVLAGWEVYHVPDSRRVTAGGWPDLVCGKAGRGCVAAELKREGQKPRQDQRWWLDRLTECGVPAFWWTPNSWPEIEAVLGQKD